MALVICCVLRIELIRLRIALRVAIDLSELLVSTSGFLVKAGNTKLEP